MPKGIYKRKKSSQEAIANREKSLKVFIYCKKCGNKFIRKGFGQKFCTECGKIETKKKKSKRATKYHFKRKKENPRHCITCNCVVGDYKKYCKECSKKIRSKREGKNYYCSEKKRKNLKRRRLKLRIEIFKRDNFTCVFCGRKSPEVILQIDHIHPKSKGGRNNKKNYQTLCRDCNIGKRDMILNEFKI